MFDSNEDRFEIRFKDVVMDVERLKLPGHVAFRVTFNSGRSPLVVARATDAGMAKFWTSIPEGRQKEAEGMGKLIEDYFRTKK